MKLTSKTMLTRWNALTAAFCVAIAFSPAVLAGGGDGDSPYNMPRNFYGGGNEGSGQGGGSDDQSGGGDSGSGSEQQKAMMEPSRDTGRGPKSADGESTAPGAEKQKELNKKFTTMPVSVLPGGSFAMKKMLDVHAVTVQVIGAKLKAPGSAQTVFGATTTASASTASVVVGTADAMVAKHLALGFRAQGSFALNAGNAKVKLLPPAAAPTAFATVSVGAVGADGVFQPESTTVVTVQSSGFDLSALVAQWSGVQTAVGKTVQVEITTAGVASATTARFAAGVAKPTLFVSTVP